MSLRDRYDFVIIGGGSAGCALANRLSADPSNQVLVLEAGRPDYKWDVFIHMPAALTYPIGNRFYDWKCESEPEPHMGGRRVYQARGKVLGGSSSINGMIFQRGNSNSPLCAPARFAMMSGQLNSKIGAYDNASEFAASTPTFAHHLRAAGYQTSLVGKMHFVGPDQRHGFEERVTTDIYPADFAWTPNWSDVDGRFDWWFHNMDSVTGAGVANASNQLDYDDDVGHHAVRKLRDLARSADDRPWLLTVSFTHPHDPYVARQEFWDLYR